uniref:Prepilin-type N-terminal cleavage/methylation domain-containing protein n=1 Tax=Dictyoglomus thermophilum TaxID=14 RepID=A0A7C3RVJ2_DICTH
MRNGLTLIEVIIGVLILGMIALLLANVLIGTIDLFGRKQESQEIFSNAQIILDRLTREIRQGSQVLDISSATDTLGKLSIQLCTGDIRSFSYTLYNGKYYFTVDGEIQAGPIKELRFIGYDFNGTYTTLTSTIRTLSITLVMDNNEKHMTLVSLRTQVQPQLSGIFITEIMYYPASLDKNGNSQDERDMEFIVLYNGTTYTVNLYGWRVNRTTRIFDSPSGSFLLTPGNYAIIGGKDSNLTNFYNLPSSYLYLKTQQRGLYSANGEMPDNYGSVVIEDDRQNVIDQVDYSYTWGGYPSGNNYYSLLRKSISAPSNDPSNWRNSLCLNYYTSSLYVYCLIPRLIINEVMYYPPTFDRSGNNRGERNMEFIELYNPTTQTINIQNWSINNNRFNTVVVGSWNIPPNGYAIIGGSNSTLNTSYNIPGSYTYIRTRNSGLGGGTSLLPNNSGNVVLRDNYNNIVDQVSYSLTWGGYRVYLSQPPNYYYYHYSLERKHIFGNSQDPANWESSNILNYYFLRLRKIGSIIYYYHYYSYCTPASKNSIMP